MDTHIDDGRRYTIRDLTAGEVQTLAQGRYKGPRWVSYVLLVIFAVCGAVAVFAWRKDAATDEGVLWAKLLAGAMALPPFLWWYLKSLRPRVRFGEQVLKETEQSK